MIFWLLTTACTTHRFNPEHFLSSTLFMADAI